MIQKALYTTASSSGLFDMLAFIFPLFIFSAGLFFIYKGFNKFSAKYLSGTIKSKAQIKNLNGENCVFSRVDFEYLTKTQEWKKFYSSTDGSFSIGANPLNVKNSELKFPPARQVSGYIKHKKNFIGKFIDRLTAPVQVIDDAIGSSPAGIFLKTEVKRGTFLDEGTMKFIEKLAEDPLFKRALKPHLYKPIRVTEYKLSNGDNVIIAYNSKGKEISPFVLSNSKQNISDFIKEKSIISMVLGSLLFLFSLILFAVISI